MHNQWKSTIIIKTGGSSFRNLGILLLAQLFHMCVRSKEMDHLWLEVSSDPKVIHNEVIEYNCEVRTSNCFWKSYVIVFHHIWWCIISWIILNHPVFRFTIATFLRLLLVKLIWNYDSVTNDIPLLIFCVHTSAHQLSIEPLFIGWIILVNRSNEAQQNLIISKG